MRLRNESAHGNRIYNTRYMKKARLVFTALKETIEADSVFAYLTVLYMYQTIHVPDEDLFKATVHE